MNPDDKPRIPDWLSLYAAISLTLIAWGALVAVVYLGSRVIGIL